MAEPVLVHAEVAAALADERPVVALESTIFSNLGLPAPHNGDALTSCLDTIRAGGAVPAVTAVLDGRARVGLEPAEHERILGSARKTGVRELGLAVGQGWSVGATTVSASLQLAAMVGITVFATGGIGGVHRGAETDFDISADLAAIAAHAVLTVCAGPKYFLDLPATLEVLETSGVPVVGLACDELPAFYSPHSGLPIPARVDDVQELAAVTRSHWALGGGGVLVTVPLPEEAAIDRAELDRILESALERARAEHRRGGAITPVILEETARLTAGRSVAANLALATNNARVAAHTAVVLASPVG
ncbi:MAG: pseudouridine-5'-phosphate glycosidase [Acidimicrobiia bacterium]|nr:pseudouridine-5'-phosphate glycosidase [Acidimicrobiia bacterium]